MPRYDLPLSEMLAADSLEFIDRNADGSVTVRDLNDGSERILDLPQMISSEGLNPKEVDIQYNTADKPLDYSPVSITDRFKMGFGNERGKAAFLKKKFEDVATNENGDFVVKDKGAWHKVDPSNLQGDPWKFAKEFASELGENVSTAISVGGTGVTTTAGSLAGPAGSLVGAAAGGAATKAINTSLGRIVGTYEATPMEELQDIGLDAIFSLAGQGIAMGAKPTFQALGRSAKKMWDMSSDTSRAMLADGLGKLTQAGPTAMKTLGESGPQVASLMEKTAARAGGDPGAIKELAKAKQIKFAEGLMSAAKRTLPRLFGEHLDEMARLADDGLEVNLASLADDAMRGIEESGIGKFVTVNGSKVFRPLSTKEVAEFGGKELPELLTREELRAIRPIVSLIQDFGHAGVLRGKDAVKKLNQFERVLNRASSKHFGAGNPALERIVTRTTETWRNGLQSTFEKAGLGEQWAQRAALYAQNGNLVRGASKLLAQDTQKGLETIVQQLSSVSGKNQAVKTTVDRLIKLVGPRGEAMKKGILLNHAVEKFAETSPKMGLWQAGGLGASATALLMGGINPAIGVPVAAGMLVGSTPRAVMSIAAKQQQLAAKGYIPYARQGLNMLRSLSPQSANLFLKNDAAVESWTRSILLGANQESQLKEELGQKLGIK